MMRIIDSPYHEFKAVMWAKCIAMGDQLDPNKPFAWEKAVMNLPRTEEYDCQRTWLFNQSVDGLLAEDLFIYVDDGRPIGPTKNLCREASRRWGSTCSWLGIQDASRKFQPPSQAPGPWAGTVTNTEGGVHGLLYQ